MQSLPAEVFVFLGFETDDEEEAAAEAVEAEGVVDEDEADGPASSHSSCTKFDILNLGGENQ